MKSDKGHELTDAILADLESRIKKEYAQAVRETQGKLMAYFSSFAEKADLHRTQVESGEWTQEEYTKWLQGQLAVGKRWEAVRNSLARDYHNANVLARSMARDTMPDVYALNHDYATYQIERGGRIDTAYTLYDRDAIARLMRDDPDILPPPGKVESARIAAGKDVRWNRQQVQSVMTQAILQGKSIPEIADDISEKLGARNYAAAVRYARTMTTETQNAGRYAGYHRAADMGVNLTIEWVATLDNRTRHDHRMLHGQRRKLDEPFEVAVEGDVIQIFYPGQSAGSSDIPQSMIWGCRCTLIAWVEGFEGDTVKEAPGMAGLSFEEWRETKPNYYRLNKDREERYEK